ncbi:hypothetical protein ABZ471_47160 [Streptomyces sp. NPDC005728]
MLARPGSDCPSRVIKAWTAVGGELFGQIPQFGAERRVGELR